MPSPMLWSSLTLAGDTARGAEIVRDRTSMTDPGDLDVVGLEGGAGDLLTAIMRLEGFDFALSAVSPSWSASEARTGHSRPSPASSTTLEDTAAHS